MKTITVEMTQKEYDEFQDYLENYAKMCDNLTDLTTLYRKKIDLITELTVENNELKQRLNNMGTDTL